MRRSRYAGFYRTFTPRPAAAAETPPEVPSVTWAEVHREFCRQWYPRGPFIRITDAKRREWLVYDADNQCAHRREFAFGARDAIVRIFWREDHVRLRYMRDDADHSTRADAIVRQLRSTHRIDFPEQAIRSTGQAIQDLYDSRRGMGRR